VSGTLAPRLVLVTRETEYDGLLARHATRGQALAFMRRHAQDAGPQNTRSLEQLEAQRVHLAALLAEIRAGVPKGWRIAAVRRAELDRFLFAPEDVVVAVGQDGLVANVAKYLSGQPVIGVNADPSRNAGVLVPHTAAAAAAMLPMAAAGTLQTERRTMIQAEMDDGQTLLALNEVFIGHASHQSARYTLNFGGREEAQSSSGLIVASGTGATGWALSISRATGVTVDLRPDEPAAMFLVREPWPSRATGASLVQGRLEGETSLLIVSRMNEGGVVFADGIEGDRLDFAWGRTLQVSVARQQLCFVPGDKPASASAPHRRQAPPPKDASPPAVPLAPEPTGKAKPPRRRWLRRIMMLVLVVLLVHACIRLLPPLPEEPAEVPSGPVAPLPKAPR
jgi:hypothetical protein